MKLAIVIIAILLTGCETPKQRSERLAKTDHGLSFATMSNGMPCVKYYERSVTCDWDFKTRGGE